MILSFIILILSICVHEFSHGYVAYLQGDKTAYYAKRLTLNPIRHLDFIGSVIVPVILIFSGASLLFGWAKPVPVRVDCLRYKKYGVLGVALAGPLSNLLLAFIGVFGLVFLNVEFLQNSFYLLIYINIVLALFNLIPLPPLDGFNMINVFLPSKIQFVIQKYHYLGMVILFFMVSTDIFREYFNKIIKFMFLNVFHTTLLFRFKNAIFLFVFSCYVVNGFIEDIGVRL